MIGTQLHKASPSSSFFHLWAQGLSDFRRWGKLSLAAELFSAGTDVDCDLKQQRRSESGSWFYENALFPSCRIIPEVLVSLWTFSLKMITLKMSWRWTLPGIYLCCDRGHTHFVYFPCRLSKLPRNWWMISSEVKTTPGGRAEHLWQPWW